MSDITALARPEIRNLVPYSAAEYADGLVRLNANETPWSAPGQQPGSGLNRYPPEKSVELTARLADWYGVDSQNLLLTRGSSEAIDLLIRCYCRAGLDAVVISPPTFGMYRVYADIQGAPVHEVPLLQDQGFALDADALVRNWPADGRILFICSPNNPTGNRFDTELLLLIARLLQGRAIVVVDAAYAEFGDEDPTLQLLGNPEIGNIAVLRTLSKAFGLAGVRCGALLGPASLIRMASCVMPPYAMPSPCIASALAALTDASRDIVRERVALIRSERERLSGALASVTGVLQVYPSEANFILVRAEDPAGFMQRAKRGGVLIRDFSRQLAGCLRITVGTPDENDQLLRSLAGR